MKFGYINKMGDHPWFVREVQGAKDKAAELGVDLLVQDVQFDANLAVTTFDTYVGDGVKGIAVVVPDGHRPYARRASPSTSSSCSLAFRRDACRLALYDDWH